MRTRGVALSIAGLLAVASLGAESPRSPLLDAVKSGDRTAIRALLQTRVDVNLPSSDGTTALHWAAQRNDLETARLLIDSGARVQAVNRVRGESAVCRLSQRQRRLDRGATESGRGMRTARCRAARPRS